MQTILNNFQNISDIIKSIKMISGYLEIKMKNDNFTLKNA